MLQDDGATTEMALPAGPIPRGRSLVVSRQGYLIHNGKLNWKTSRGVVEKKKHNLSPLPYFYFAFPTYSFLSLSLYS